MIRESLAAAVACLLVASCSAGHDATGTSYSQQDVARARQSLNGLWIGSGVVLRAEDELIGRCMTRAGSSWNVGASTKDLTLNPVWTDRVAEARENGYGLRADVEETKRIAAKDHASAGSRTPQERTAYDVAINGPKGSPDATYKSVDGSVISAGTKGCHAEVAIALFGSVVKWLQYFDALDNSIRMSLETEVNSDRTVKKKLARWDSCMRKKGYKDVEGRSDARAEAETNYDTMDADAAETEERRIAADDAGCDKAVGYTVAARKVQGQAMARFLDRHEKLVVALQEIRSTAVANARAALGSGQ